MKSKLLITAVMTVFALGMPLTMSAAEKEKPKAEKAEKKAEAGRAVPFHGDVSAVDKAAQTFTLGFKKGDHVFSVTADTKITNKGKDAKFDDITVGAYVTGTYIKDGDKSVAKSVKLGEEKKEKGQKGGDAGGAKADPGGAKADPGGAKPEAKK